MTATLPPAICSSRSNCAPRVELLTNGAIVIAEQIPIDAVNLNVWLGVGSAIETDDINGMAHFLEHMVFKGTAQLQPGEFDRRVEARGAVMNAATSQDYTHYFITTAPQDFAQLVPLQLDVVCNASIPDAEFERERLVVREEIRRSEDNPTRRTYARAMETCFPGLPYRRPILGPDAVIAGLVPDQMRAFHKRHYCPAAMTVAAVGNLPEQELIDIVTAGFDCVAPASGDRVRHILPDLEPPFTEIVRHEYTDPQLQQARLVMLWRAPGLQDLDNTYALDVLAAILGQGKSSRLFRDLREERQLALSISAYNATNKFQGSFYISARLETDRITATEAALTDHVMRLQSELVSDAELARIRTQVANRFIFSSEKPSELANLYGYYYSQLGDIAPALNYAERVRRIEATDVRAAARQYLSPTAYGIVVARPPAG
ncbi:putative Zn-dependent peptidase [Rubidibacter lacunae KORDI 51-2]|uniref:Putative Zn-dependent peptidase n=1 Tax=Rubidibacter lacunae KORDI 51-2 TaxID=582515 RepID=U5DP90_9CHRO|nr:pitrilysin family protein [Rubidibacter lacunae]ERN41520.1 putative Zn-dependent peptidase [Rubidibacter lacunae KORDI 51-2]